MCAELVGLLEDLGSDYGLEIDRAKLLSDRQIVLLRALLARCGAVPYMEAVEHVLMNCLWAGRRIDSWLYFLVLVGMPTRRACETAAQQQFPDPAVILYEADAANVLSMNLFIGDGRAELDVFLLSAAILHSGECSMDIDERWSTVCCTQTEVLAAMVELLRSVTDESRQQFVDHLESDRQKRGARKQTSRNGWVTSWYGFGNVVAEIIQDRRRKAHAKADGRTVGAE